jgi:uncharacterized membrane protein
MNDVPVEILVAGFHSERGADDAIESLKKAKWDGLNGVQNAAVLRRDRNDKLHIKETGDMSGGKGALIGGVVGGVVGLLAGPIGWAAIGGATIGGLAAKLRDSGFNDEQLKQMGTELTPGTSAIIAVIEQTWVRDAEQMLAQQGANVATQELGQEIGVELASNHDVAYAALQASGVTIIEQAMGKADQTVPAEAAKGDAGVEAKGAQLSDESTSSRGGAPAEETKAGQP